MSNAKVYGGIFQAYSSLYAKILDYVIGIIGSQFIVVDATHVIAGYVDRDHFKRTWNRLIDQSGEDLELWKVDNKLIWRLRLGNLWYETNEHGLLYVER